MNFHAIVEIPKGAKHPRFAKLPELESFAKSDTDRKLVTVFRSFRNAGAPFVAPPGTPKDRVEILLREAMRRDISKIQNFWPTTRRLSARISNR